MNHKLGKKPVRHDHRTLKLRAYLPSLPPLPGAIDWSLKVPLWNMDLNDQLGCCVIAAASHMDMLWTANAGNEVIPADSDVLAAYEAVGGYNPSDPSTDQGCVMLDALNYWRNTGMFGGKINSYVSLDITSVEELQAAVALFGAAYIGVNLTQADMDNSGLWDNAFDPNAVIGGHAIPLVAYGSNQFICVTWGAVKTLTAEWLKPRIEEAYCVLSPAWIAANGSAPSGFNAAQLQQDLAAL